MLRVSGGHAQSASSGGIPPQATPGERTPDIRPADQFQRFDEGYWNRVGGRAQLEHYTNATLYAGVDPTLDTSGVTESINLWVYNVSSDFAIAGSTAQSRNRRTFFAHNLVQPALEVALQTPNQYEYGRLAEFVRRAQVNCLNRSSLMRLVIPGVSSGGAKRNLKYMKEEADRGGRLPLDALGYVRNMARNHERWVNAPENTFSFVVARWLTGLAQDEDIKLYYIQSWMDIFEDPKFQADFIGDPDASKRHHASNDGANNPQPPAPQGNPPAPTPPPLSNPPWTDIGPNTFPGFAPTPNF